MSILQDEESTILISLRDVSTISQAENTKEPKDRQYRQYLRDIDEK
jgi:hypothetical protein